MKQYIKTIKCKCVCNKCKNYFILVEHNKSVSRDKLL